MKVCKFGGSSLADAKQLTKVIDIVLSDPARRIVVVSAPGSELRLQKRKNIRHMEMCGVELTKFHQQYFYSQKKLLSLRRILGI